MSTSDHPPVSVIVLNHDGLEHLEACLDSLSEVRFPRGTVEIILADNGSRDTSVAYTRERFPDVRVLELGANHGFARGNNLAAREARGEVVVFLNNDTRVDPGFLEPLVEPVLENAATATGSLILSFDGDRVLYKGGRANLFGFGYQIGLGDESRGGEKDAPPFETLFPCGCATAMRRDAFLRTGGFDEDFFAYYEDVDLGWRTWLLGGRVLVVPRSVVYHKHDGSFGKVASARKQLLWNRNVLFLLFKNCEEESLRRLLPLAVLLTLERATYFLHQETEAERSAVQAMFASIEDDARREQEIREVGIAHLRALGEFVAALPGLREKRERIQSSRSLEDGELRSRFPQELTFEDQVNGLVRPSWHDRLLPLFELDGLLGKSPIEDHLFSRLEKLEDCVLDYRRTVDMLSEELVRKTRDQEEKAAHLDQMAAHITDLERDRAELFRLRSKSWFKAIRRLGRLLGR